MYYLVAWIFSLKTIAFSNTAEAFTAQNELLEPQTIAETRDSVDKSGSSNFTTVKHIVFAMIWAFVAWNLLIVKEKNLPKYDVVVNSNQTKSKIDFQMSLDWPLFHSF